MPAQPAEHGLGGGLGGLDGQRMAAAGKDAGLGARNLAQTLGRRSAMALAWALAVGVGIGVGIAFMARGTLQTPTVGLGVIGLAAVVQGAGSAQRLWYGMLVAALCWTVAWALGTG